MPVFPSVSTLWVVAHEPNPVAPPSLLSGGLLSVSEWLLPVRGFRPVPRALIYGSCPHIHSRQPKTQVGDGTIYTRCRCTRPLRRPTDAAFDHTAVIETFVSS